MSGSCWARYASVASWFAELFAELFNTCLPSCVPLLNLCEDADRLVRVCARSFLFLLACTDVAHVSLTLCLGGRRARSRWWRRPPRASPRPSSISTRRTRSRSPASGRTWRTDRSPPVRASCAAIPLFSQWLLCVRSLLAPVGSCSAAFGSLLAAGCDKQAVASQSPFDFGCRLSDAYTPGC